MRSSTSEPDRRADPRAAIRQRALAEGFDAVGFARAEAPAGAADGLAAYLARTYHGDMAWMETTAARRADPARLWPEAKTVVALGLSYAPERDPLTALADKTAGAISVYAQGDDYHDVIKKRLKRVARFMVEELGGDVKVFVDTAPVMEKPLAGAAGLGWQGKHTNLVSRRYGSWLFLGSIFTTLAIDTDASEPDHCGTCRACLDICPTRAFPAPYQLDARRCISYLTIEHKGHIPRALRAGIGNRIYGCDDCLAVCPWNKFATAAHEVAFTPRAQSITPRLEELAALDDAGFRTLFRRSPIKRIGRDRFVRNVLIAIGNSGNPALAGSARLRLADASPLVRAMAVWALSRLLDPSTFTALADEHAPREMDTAVVAEWDQRSG